jgi:hypothetical protein
MTKRKGSHAKKTTGKHQHRGQTTMGMRGQRPVVRKKTAIMKVHQTRTTRIGQLAQPSTYHYCCGRQFIGWRGVQGDDHEITAGTKTRPDHMVTRGITTPTTMMMTTTATTTACPTGWKQGWRQQQE